jgi:Ca2+/Na+ antiporter
MSFSDRAILWLHVAVVIFTVGPVTAAIMATPRYIRQRNAVMVGYLYRITRIYTLASLLLLVFGLILAQLLHDFSKPWLSVSLTLYVVAVVLLILIMRDQHAAASALEAIAAEPGESAVAPVEGETAPAAGPQATGAAPATAAGQAAAPTPPTAAGQAAAPTPPTAAGQAAAQTPPTAPAATARAPERIAAVERGRIASLAGITGLIWLVILVLMVWR